MSKPPADEGRPSGKILPLRAVPTSKGGLGKTNAEAAPWLNKTEAARLIGVNSSSVHDWGRQGSPGVKAGKDGGVNLGLQRQWDIERAYQRGIADGAKARTNPDALTKEEIQAKREMIGLIEDERGLLTKDTLFIPVSVVEARYGRILGRIAQEMLTLSVRVETDMEMAVTPAEKRDVIDDAVKAIIITMRTDAIIMGREDTAGQSFDDMTEEDLEKVLGAGEEEAANRERFAKEAEAKSPEGEQA